MRGKEQLSLEEEVGTRSIAFSHIHVERAIEQEKNYPILQGVIPIFTCSWKKFGIFVAYILTKFVHALVSNLVIYIYYNIFIIY